MLVISVSCWRAQLKETVVARVGGLTGCPGVDLQFIKPFSVLKSMACPC